MGRQSNGGSKKSPKTSTSRSTTQVTVRKDPTSTRRPHEVKGKELTTKRTGGSSTGHSTTTMTTTAWPRTAATSRRTSGGTTLKPTTSSGTSLKPTTSGGTSLKPSTSALSTTSAPGYNENHEGNNQPTKGRAGTGKEIRTREDGELQAKERKCAIVKMKARCGWNSSEHCRWVGESCTYVGGPREVHNTGKTRVSAAALGNWDHQDNQLGAFLLIIILLMKLLRF